MKEVAKVDTDADLATILEIRPTALSNFKRDDNIPVGLVVKFAVLHERSVDYIMFGDITKSDITKSDLVQDGLVLERKCEIETSNYRGPERRKNFGLRALIDKAVAVLSSDYALVRAALEQNILAFYQALGDHKKR